MDIERVVLTPQEAAAMLNISESKLREFKAAGLIAYLPFGPGGLSYRREDVLAFRDSMVTRTDSVRITSTKTAVTTQYVPDWLVKARAEGQSAGLTSGKQAAS